MLYSISTIETDKLKPGPWNPRKVKASDDEDKQLKASIKQHGLIQPLVVTAGTEGSGNYLVVAGGRRLKAITALKIESVPCVVVEIGEDAEAIELALAENFAR